jgi:hypothetical protein
MPGGPSGHRANCPLEVGNFRHLVCQFWVGRLDAARVRKLTAARDGGRTAAKPTTTSTVVRAPRRDGQAHATSSTINLETEGGHPDGQDRGGRQQRLGDGQALGEREAFGSMRLESRAG